MDMASRLFAVLLTAFMLVSQPAAALVYVSVLGGINFLKDGSITDPGATFGSNSTFESSTGYNVAGAVGVEFTGLRFEGEIGFAANQLDQFTSVPGNGTVTTGTVSSLSYMGNVYYDLPIPFIKPYVGVGLGMATISMDAVSAVGMSPPFAADSSDTVFAWQAGAGIALSMAPFMKLVLDYRYFSASDPTLTNALGNDFSFEYKRQTFRAGIRIGF